MSEYHTKKYPVLITVKITVEQYKKLKDKAKKQGISASEIIRSMIMYGNTEK